MCCQLCSRWSVTSQYERLQRSVTKALRALRMLQQPGGEATQMELKLKSAHSTHVCVSQRGHLCVRLRVCLHVCVVAGMLCVPVYFKTKARHLVEFHLFSSFPLISQLYLPYLWFSFRWGEMYSTRSNTVFICSALSPNVKFRSSIHLTTQGSVSKLCRLVCVCVQAGHALLPPFVDFLL